MPSYGMATLLMASSCIAAVHADVKVTKTQLPTPVQKLVARKFCTPIKNEAACAASPAPLAPLVPPCPLDQKKVVQLPSLSTSLVVPDPADAASTTLELDELWSFVLNKAKEVWVWIALCRETRQVVAYTLGDRSKQTCLRLWEAIPSIYRKGQCFTDFWAACSAVIAEEQHTAVAKRRERPPTSSGGITHCGSV